jgi:hypothetical protein
VLFRGANNGLRYISLCPLPADITQHYHIFFNDDTLNRFFIEAPLYTEQLAGVSSSFKIMAAYENRQFFEQVKPLLEQIVGKASLVDKGIVVWFLKKKH